MPRGNSIEFISAVDKKGRALLSAGIRKSLLLKFGSEILVEINGTSFRTKVDERGRFGVPKRVRGEKNG